MIVCIRTDLCQKFTPPFYPPSKLQFVRAVTLGVQLQTLSRSADVKQSKTWRNIKTDLELRKAEFLISQGTIKYYKYKILPKLLLPCILGAPSTQRPC